MNTFDGKCYSKITTDTLKEATDNMRRAAREEYISRRTEAPAPTLDHMEPEDQRKAVREDFLNRRYQK